MSTIDVNTFLAVFLTELQKFVTSEQLPIALLGVTAVFLSQSANKELNRYASIFGLIGQPFWFYMAYKTSSWGVFFLCLLYSYSWWTGFKRHWLTKPKATV